MKTIETYHFYISVGVTEQSWLVPWNCALVAVDFAAAFLGTTDATSGLIVVATNPLTNTYTTGTPGVVASLRQSISVGAAGAIVPVANKFVQIPEPGIQLSKNSKIWCYMGVNGAITPLANVVCFFKR